MEDDRTIADALSQLTLAFGTNPLAAIRSLEEAIPFQSGEGVGPTDFLSGNGFSPATLHAALAVKRVAGQINVLVHAAGILASLPHILQAGEVVQEVSLGAGNTGKEFDLTTNLRVAEFKFISWRGGSEAIRQNSVFKDFMKLLWDESGRRKQLFLTGTEQAVKFMQGGRSLDSVLSRNVKLKSEFGDKYGPQFQRVGDFYGVFRHEVEIVDLKTIIPTLSDVDIPADEPPLAET